MVMARHGLVQRQRGQLVERARAQIVGVHEILSRHAAARVAHDVAPGGVGGRDGVGHRLHAVRQSRQRHEHVGHARVRALGDPGGGAQQRLGRLGVELVVGAQKGQELREGALEADLLDDRVHLGADARDLVEAEGVDLLGGEVERGVPPHQRRVALASLRQARGRELGTGGGEVLLGEEAQDLRIGWPDRLGDGGVGVRSQPLGLGRRDGGGQVRERLGERMGRRVRHLHPREGRDHPLDDERGLGPAGLHPPAHVGDVLLGVAREVAVARDQRLGVVDRADRRRARGVLDVGEEAVVIDERRARLVERQDGLVSFEIVREQAERGAVRVAQRLAVDRRRARLEGGDGLALLRERGGRDRGKPAGGLRVAFALGEEGILGESPSVVLGGEHGEVVGRIGRCGRAGEQRGGEKVDAESHGSCSRSGDGRA